MNSGDFYKKTGFVTLAVLLIIIAVKFLIIDEIKEISKTNPAVPEISAVPAGEPAAGTRPASDFETKEMVKIKPQDAASYLGRYVVTEGVIVGSYNSGKVCFLNFDKNYKQGLSLVIFASDFVKFPESPEKYFLNKKVRVEGRVKDYKGKVEIIVKSMDQVKIL
jgi:predicted extracellular nuclease